MSCSCGTGIEESSLEQSIQEKINNHPCYSEGAHHHYARIHLSVAPACNIQCNYCNRKYDCSNESRPGVTTEKLTPEEAAKKVLFVGGEVHRLSVVGIAGPGDALANPKKTFETFAYMKEYAPDLKLCLSTNGLALPKYIDEIERYGVDHITVTINSVDETGEIGAKIYPWVYWEKEKRRGTEGAKILLEKQLEGIKMAVERGILIKANSVLIPGINDKHLAEVAKKLKSLGVFLHNIMPIISEPEFGTYFGLNGVKSATYEEQMAAQEACGMDMQLMQHCRQCRADAVGLIGEDRGQEFDKEVFADMSFEELRGKYDLAGRAESHEKIEQWRKALDEANEKVKIIQATKEQLSSTGETYLVAVTSAGEGVINQHFGSVSEFLIYEAGDKGVKFVQHRKVANAYCSGPENCDGTNPIEEIKDVLRGVPLLLTMKIGECPQNDLAEIGLKSDDSYSMMPIEASVLQAVTKHFFQAPIEAEA